MRILCLVFLICLVFNLHAVASGSECLIQQARRCIGWKETPGRNNRGPEIDKLVLSVGGRPGLPWCGFFMMYIHQRCSLPKAGGMAMSWFTRSSIVSSPTPGDVFSVWNRYLNRIGHVGLVELVTPSGNAIVTIEGNTNGTGSREGSGVCRLTRPRKQIYSFARWWKKN